MIPGTAWRLEGIEHNSAALVAEVDGEEHREEVRLEE
jgi:hypothetical protein